MDGIQLDFKKDAIEMIAELAFENKLGARGLRSICESILKEAMFETPRNEGKRKLSIDRKYIVDHIDPQMIRKSA